MTKLLPLSFSVLFLALAGCSTTLVREEPQSIRLGETGVRCAVAPLAEALLKRRGTLVQSIQGSRKENVFSAECVMKGESDRFTAIFLAPQMRLATLTITSPHTLTFDRARQIPEAFAPEYALFDLAMVNLPTAELRRALDDGMTIVEHGRARTVFAAGVAVAVRTLLPDGSIRYENIPLEYSYVVKKLEGDGF